MRNHGRTQTLVQRPAFTLLEIIVTLVIIGILAAAGMPAVARAISHSSVNNAATVVAGDLEAAFSLASRQRRPVRVRFNAGTRSYAITDRATSTVLRTRTLDNESDLKVGSIAGTPSSVDVFPNGLASGPIAVTIATNGYTATVSMTRAGKVRITH
jgi:prepilin-type N-terminal cleavage/methylation domain-containing protein